MKVNMIMKFYNYIESIEEFARKSGLKIDPIPSISLNNDPQGRFDPFIQTANYGFQSNTITLFINGRHVKDILRSFCHELIHHVQYLEDPDKYLEAVNSTDDTSLVEDGSLIEELEADAYMRGNLLMRKWTERKDLI